MSQAPTGSLAARMQERREQLERSQSTFMDIPGYDDLICVAYRAIGWQRINKIVDGVAGERDPSLRQLYAAADTLIAAREQVYEVTPEGTLRAIDASWHDLCEGAGVALPEDATERVALLALFEVDSRVMSHYGEYERWLGGQRIGQELVRDFERTG